MALVTDGADSFEQILRAIRDHWGELIPLLTAATRPRMRFLLDRLDETTTDSERWAARNELSELLLAVLDEGHPVRTAVLNATRGTAQLESFTETARELLDRLDGAGSGESEPTPPEVEYWSARRLLAEPAVGEDDVRMLGVNPADLDLIRLRTFDGSARWPEFQFGPDGAPHQVVIVINRILEVADDPWGAADWWLAGNTWLGGVPAELLGVVPDATLVTAAQATDPEA
jgi:hypothetical protein